MLTVDRGDFTGVKKIGDLLKEYLKEMGWLAGNPYEPLFTGVEEDSREKPLLPTPD